MFWYVKCDITTEDEIDLDVIDDYEDFSADFEPNYDKVKIYPDSIDIDYVCPLNSYNGEYKFPPGFLDIEDHKIVINWYLTDNRLTFENIEGNFTLYTLDYVLRKFAKPRSINFNGEVVLFYIHNSQIPLIYENLKVLVYNIKNSKLVYHINKSLDYTNLWINCYKLEDGIFTFTKVNGIPFRTLLQRHIANFNENDDVDAFEIFESLYRHI
jgi:hypothetical protein